MELTGGYQEPLAKVALHVHTLPARGRKFVHAQDSA